MYDGSIVIKAELDTKEFDKQVKNLENKRISGAEFLEAQKTLRTAAKNTEEFQRALQIQRDYVKQSKDITQETNKQKTATKEVVKETINAKKEIAQAEQATKKTSSAFSSIGTIISGLAISGIVALMFQAGSQSESVKQTIEQISNILSGIIQGLAELLLPIVEKIVDWIYKILGFVAIFLKDVLGLDIGTQKVNNNFKQTNKQVKALRKQLMGFDEMNILNKDGSIGGLGTGSSGGTGGGNTKTKDYGVYNDMSDLDKGLADLGLVAVYTGDDLKYTRLELEQLIADVKNGQATMTKKNGIITITNKAGKSIKLTTKEYEKLLDDINKSRVTSRNLDIWRKVKDSFQNWNVDSFKTNMNSAINFAKNGIDGATITYEKDMVKIKLATGEVFTFTKEQWEKIKENAKLNADGTKTNWTNALSNIKDKAHDITEAISQGNFEIKDGLVQVKLKTGEVVQYSIFEFIKLSKELNEVGKSGKNSANETKKSWIDTANEIINKLTGKGEKGLVGVATSVFDSLPDNVKVSAKSALDAVNDMINKFKPKSKTIDLKAKLDTSGMMETLRKLAKSWPVAFQPVVSALQKQGFKNGGIVDIPRLANGGIINRPGKGVPLAIGGEVSREGVIPMDNQSQMALLGREIAKHIPINLTNVTELDGRVIARSVSQVMNEMQFASNGGVM